MFVAPWWQKNPLFQSNFIKIYNIIMMRRNVLYASFTTGWHLSAKSSSSKNGSKLNYWTIEDNSGMLWDVHYSHTKGTLLQWLSVLKCVLIKYSTSPQTSNFAIFFPAWLGWDRDSLCADRVTNASSHHGHYDKNSTDPFQAASGEQLGLLSWALMTVAFSNFTCSVILCRQ